MHELGTTTPMIGIREFVTKSSF